ncbi:MAG: C10 family peptidase [Prevotella sp.]|uniref:C10 family peptidase n=1 Tax=Prevotella sp. TaxID=59823 RepID=UPI002A3127B9|nr:C10 family peptidase [Prevotella sp.]MDD7317641.1 C10 family peptidase [Prevotellaceae bacterium]MDY4020512.1 C10 family peptidase [Prevotella sp.]
MNKKIYTILTMMLVCIVAVAGPVTPKQAYQKAMQFMNKDGQNAVKAVKMAGKVQKGVAANNEKLQSYYIFNADNNQGFVIISGEDRLPEVFGYGEKENLDTENMPENMKMVLDMYDRLVKYVASQPESYKPENISLARRQAKTGINPLLETKWSQDKPYNTLCPKDGTKYSATGCAATSMAQVMYYHKWPEANCEPIPAYYTSTLQKNLDELPATTFQWDKMQNTYGWWQTDTDNAVSKLMQYCGYSIEMNYSAEGSGAFSFLQPYALKKYFGYDNRTRLIERDEFTIDVWINIIYNELAENRPVVYSGVTSKKEGHSFVLDGYRQSDGFFHVNWGWNGISDNYFDITVLNPNNTTSTGSASTNEGFALQQDAIIGMQKPTGHQDPFKDYLTSSINSLRGNVIDCSYINLTPKRNTFDIGIGYYNENGRIEVLAQNGTAELGKFNYFPSITYNLSSLIHEPGTYKIFPISKLSTEEKWQPGDAADYIYVKTVLDNEGKMTSTLYPVFAINVDKVLMTDTTKTNKEITVTYNLSNKLDEAYNGQMYFNAKSIDGKDEIKQEAECVVNPKGKKDIIIKFTPKRNGKYRIILSSDNTYSNRLSDETHQIGETEPSFEVDLNVEDMVRNNNSNYLYSGVANGKVILKNTGKDAYNHNVKIELAGRKDGMYVTEYQTENLVNIASGESTEIPFNFNGMVENKKYMFRFFYEYNEMVKFSEYRFTAKAPNTNGIENTGVDAQEDDNSQIFDVTGRRIKTDADGKLQRGIYIKNGKKYVSK